MTGILLVDKPEGMTSAGVIRVLKPLLGGARVGHLGTLDPFASGLLPLCIGEATKVARYLLLERKAYTGTIRLGSATDTLDRTGTVTEQAAVPTLTQADVAAVAKRFTGPQQQTPPMYSALKRDGVPLYKLARQGIEVDRQARDIVIHAFTLTLHGADCLEFEVECSKGTYIRVLAADVGRTLGTVAHLERLRRTAVGAFQVSDALPPDALIARGGAALPLVPVRAALAELPTFAPAPEDLIRLRRGQQAPLGRLPRASRPGQTALLLDPKGDVAGVIEVAGPHDAWRLVRLLET